MTKESNQVKRNLIFNILSLGINVVVGILYTPYLVKSLGIVAYGVVPLALIINQYVSVVTGSLTSALTRFYTIALQKDDKQEASKYISTSLIVIFGLIILLSIPLFFVVKNIDNIFTIPIELVESAKTLFTFTLLSFAASLISSVFNITLYAYNRLDYLNVIKIFRIAFKFVFVVLLFVFLDKDIAYVGIANFISEVAILIFSIYIFKSFTKGNVSINLRLFDKASLSVLSVMASWVIIQQLGDTMLYRIDNIIVNKFWSTKESGILGAFTELGSYTMVIAGVIGSLFGPLILQAYGREDHDTVKRMTLDRSISVGVMVAVMAGIIIGFSPIILKIWLNEEIATYNLWLYIKLILVPFYSAAGVFAFAARAWNKVKFPAVGTLILGLMNFSIVWAIANYYNTSDFAIPLILIVCSLFGIVQSYFLNGYVFSTFYKGTLHSVLLGSLKILAVMISISAIGYFLSPVMTSLNSILNIIIIAIIALIALIISFKIALTKEQAEAMLSIVYNKKQ